LIVGSPQRLGRARRSSGASALRADSHAAGGEYVNERRASWAFVGRVTPPSQPAIERKKVAPVLGPLQRRRGGHLAELLVTE
jgi:hypothetical protein